MLEDLNPAQRAAVATTEGPVLLIAGPDTDKILTLAPRHPGPAHVGLGQPNEIVLCTFTENAALEFRDRLRSGALAIG